VLAELPGSSEELSSTLFRLGWRSAQDVAEARIEELKGVPGVGGEAGAARLKEAATQFVNEERRKRGEGPLPEKVERSAVGSPDRGRMDRPERPERAERFDRSPPPPAPAPRHEAAEPPAGGGPVQAGAIPGLDREVAQRLHEAGYTSLEMMDEEDEERLADAADLTLDEARDLKRRVHRVLALGHSTGRNR
jgi:hypothetical protein